MTRKDLDQKDSVTTPFWQIDLARLCVPRLGFSGSPTLYSWSSQTHCSWKTWLWWAMIHTQCMEVRVNDQRPEHDTNIPNGQQTTRPALGYQHISEVHVMWDLCHSSIVLTPDKCSLALSCSVVAVRRVFWMPIQFCADVSIKQHLNMCEKEIQWGSSTFNIDSSHMVLLGILCKVSAFDISSVASAFSVTRRWLLLSSASDQPVKY